MRRKLAVLFLSIFLVGLLFPLLSLAGDYQVIGGKVQYGGLVPCGKPVLLNDHCCIMPCTFCHFFVMFNGIVNFVIVYIVPVVAVLMLVVGGVMFYFAGGSPKLLTQGKNLIIYAIVGLVIVYAAYLIVGLALQIIGVAKWTGLNKWFEEGSFTVNCSIKSEYCNMKKYGGSASTSCEDAVRDGYTPCYTHYPDGTPIKKDDCNF